MKRQTDGFSLVEVIIAIAVLAIVAMFLLSYFSGANRYANWGKTTQKADMAAQSVVEELESCTTLKQIEDKITASGSAWTVIATPDPSGADEYRLSRKISADDTQYTARVQLDFESYKETPPVPTTTPVSKFNRYEVPQIEEVYSDTSVVFEETDQTTSAVGDIFYQVYKNNHGIAKSTIENGLKRTMHIHIAPYADASGGDTLYLVKGYYEYEYKEAGTTYKSELPISDVKIEKDNLKKIYLFYYPVNGSLNEETLDVSKDSSMPAGFNLANYAFYPILQKSSVTPPADYKLKILAGGGTLSSADLVKKVYTNMTLSSGVSDNLITRKAETRIAKVTVEIYNENETVFNEENRIVMVQTSKGV